MHQDVRRLYRALVRARRFDEVSLALQRQGAIDVYSPARGQEAAHIGAVVTLRASDWMFPTYRQPGAMLERGISPRELWAHYAGADWVAWDWRAVRTGPYTIPLGTQLAHATGLAWGSRRQGRDDVVLAYFGDGASSQGEVHEAMNYASVFDAPIVFFCENNGWAISVPWDQQSAVEHVADRAQGYGFEGIVVDGQDALAVAEVTRDAVARVRNGGGPVLIEAMTYRVEGHTTSDDPTIYRTEEALEPWRRRDPLLVLEERIRRDAMLDDDEMTQLRSSVDEEFDAAVAAWQTERGRA